MASISPSALHDRQDSPSGSENPRKRRRPTDPPHSVPPTPGPEASPEERRSARAQRNRIAAQISRDRRKEEQKYLRDRIDELERENRMLRSAIASGSSVGIPSPTLSSISIETSHVSSDQWRRDIESENRDLRTKVANLERMFSLIAPAAAAVNALTPTSSHDASPISPAVVTPVDTPLQTVPTRHLAAGGQLESSPYATPISLAPVVDRTNINWILGLLHQAAGSGVGVPALSTVSAEEEARPDDGPLPTQASSAFDEAASLHPGVAFGSSSEMSGFLPTPEQTIYSGSDLDLSDFALEGPKEPVADAASAEIVEEMMSKYLNDMVSDQSWAWEACGLEGTEGEIIGGVNEVNVF